MSWRRYFSRAVRDRERAEELEVHFERLIDHYIAQDVPPNEARRRARLTLGNARAKREEVNDMNRLPVLDTVGRDVRYAFRMLRRSPAFTATAVMTLALVIGANTAVASLADAILLRPLPYPHPDRLATIVTSFRAPQGEGIYESQDGRSWETLRDQAASLDVALSAASFGGGVNAVIDHVAAIVHQARVSAGYFRVLGIAPVIGREFTFEEDRPGAPPVAVISHQLWQRQLHGDPAVVGKTMLLRGEACTIVGVMPEAFQNPGEPVDLWTPARPSRKGEGGGANYGVITRVRDGHTWAMASAELAALGRATFKARGDVPAGADVWWSLVPMQEALVSSTRQPIELLAGAMAMVLLIACVNIATLLLARGRSRTREIATRMALGSGRSAVVRQLMVEHLLLSMIGGTVGLVLGYFSLEGLKALGGATFTEWNRGTFNVRMLGMTAGLSLITSLLFGLIPALQTSRLDVNTVLATGASRNVAGGAAHWMQRVLVAAEVGLGVVLLIITGLLIRTFVNLRSLEPGFDSSHVMTATVSLQDAGYKTSVRVNHLFEESVSTLQRTPGVVSAAVSLELPFRRLLNQSFRLVDESAVGPSLVANATYVTPRFFETLRIPFHAGRDFDQRDRAGAQAVAIVNDTFVRSWSKGVSPLGRRVRIGNADREIVGVVGDVLVRDSGIDFPGRARAPLTQAPVIFVPAAQTSDDFLQLVHMWFQPVWSIRTDRTVNVARVMPNAITQVDPLLPVQGVQSLSAVQAAATDRQRILMFLVAMVTGAAVLLAAVGIYGLVTQGIVERTREFGIRLALGATTGRVVRSLVLSGVVVGAVGGSIGLGLAWMTVAIFDSFSLLFHVEKHDPLTFVTVPLLLLVVASISSLLPARRILRMDPAISLRE
jgi:predicted permease